LVLLQTYIDGLLYCNEVSLLEPDKAKQ
jgi:hypothetical protein